MNRKELEAEVERYCKGEGRTHYNTCPCSILVILNERDGAMRLLNLVTQSLTEVKNDIRDARQLLLNPRQSPRSQG